MLTFELDKKKEKLEIHCDTLGLDLLIKNLKSLKNSNDNIDHLHLMSPDWGGNEMSNESEKQNDSSIFINHVKVFKWEK